MFLEITSDMKLVYQLSKKIELEPDYIIPIQRVTLDHNKPNVGLKGIYGLFGSVEWWESIRKKIMKTTIVSGKIIRVYSAGQDNVNSNNSFDILLENGKVLSESIYVNNSLDIDLFKLDHTVTIFYAHDERKLMIDNKPTYSDTVIEMAISYYPYSNAF